MNEHVSKGIFWFICLFNEMDECDFSENELIAFPVPCDRNRQVMGDNSRHYYCHEDDKMIQ